jgi:uncharacterized repeat protein (TIGR03803 family)
MRSNGLSIGLRAALAIFAVTLSLTSAWAATREWKEKVLHSFCSQSNCVDGRSPSAGLIFDAAGNLYGTTTNGGTYNYGTVFELTPRGGGNWEGMVLYSFCSQNNCTDGVSPFGGLTFDAAGNLYGATYWGGAYYNSCGFGCGTVFELRPTTGGGWTEQVLHNFGNAGDGANPEGGLIFDAAGNLYSTTPNGGSYGFGTVFDLAPSGGGNWAETVLYAFCSPGRACPGAFRPVGGVIFDAFGNLYGMTNGGGAYGNYGTVFEVTPNGSGGWTGMVLHSFGNGADGFYPQAGLVLDAAGNLYGTTQGGGTYGDGIAFELTPAGGGNWAEKVLYSFCAQPKCADGAGPFADLIVDATGNLYGTTGNGGTYGYGTVFELSPTAGGGWTEQVLNSFGNGTDGYGPAAGLLFDASGNLYGTTYDGGLYNEGTVFELSPVYPCATCSHAVHN